MTDVKLMARFLKSALELENYLYIWNQALNKVNGAIRQSQEGEREANRQFSSKEHEYQQVEAVVARERENEKNKTKSSFKSGMLAVPAVIACYGIPFVVGAIEFVQEKNLSFIDGVKAYTERELGTSGMIVVVLVAALFVLSAIYCAVSAIVSFAKKDASGNWNKEIRKRKERIRQEMEQKQNVVRHYRNATNVLVQKRNQILNNLRLVSEEREKLYSLNYLPQKYQHLVAVATMYEYLTTGRCTTVEGHGGIFDTYEYDCRLGYIISNLEQINSKLDVVISNQNALYLEMQRANDNLGRIESELGTLNQHAAAIERNTAISAVADQQMAAIARSEAMRRGIYVY